MDGKRIRIGSRGSDLALWQAEHVRGLLQSQFPDALVDISIIHTKGDKILDQPLATIGGKGLFTKEIENALIANDVDIAVHSLKDLPTELDERLTIASIPRRANIEDVFLSNDPKARLLELEPGATVATGSLRRKSQILAHKPDLKIEDIRGNVPTRIRKLQDSTWSGMILAKAGVERLGLMEFVRETLSTELVLPAVGQGALAIQTRSSDRRMIDLVGSLDHPQTRWAVEAERALLRAMGGGCQVPIGAHATVLQDTIELHAVVAHPEGTSIIKGRHAGPVSDAELVGTELAKSLLADGGQEILNLVYRLQTSDESVDPRPQV